ncbi:MAG: FKBP-type peptidyl-prolyl cis-trans isomerase [Prevotella sp.]|jgi:FKBP-type peptidyl-prolyl cis-trans isomerase FklB|nr:FKBP-type peptidyl-prolyl cis-trans isomerase [Prevotella sp.]
MKKIVLLALAVVASASFCTIDAKKKKKEATDVKAEPVIVPVELKSSSDSVSYTAGMTMTNGLLTYLVQQQGVDTAYMADFIRGFKEIVEGGDNPQQKAYAAGMEIANQVKGRMLPGITNEFKDSPDSIVNTLLFRGFTDALMNDSTLFKFADAEAYFKQKQETDRKAKEEKLYGPNRDAGINFLKANALKDSVITTPSGLQYKVLVKGEGEVPQKTDKVLVNYEGRLIDGTVFDASKKHGDKPASFRADQVIKGWTEALTMMPVGSKWQLYIPQELAYGERNMGNIKPFSALIFDVELVGIDKPKTEEPAKANSSKPTKATAKKVSKKK